MRGSAWVDVPPPASGLLAPLTTPTGCAPPKCDDFIATPFLRYEAQGIAALYTGLAVECFRAVPFWRTPSALNGLAPMLAAISLKHPRRGWLLAVFRDTFASTLCAATKDLLLVSKLLGHSSPTITAKRYATVFQDDAVDAVALAFGQRTDSAA